MKKTLFNTLLVVFFICFFLKNMFSQEEMVITTYFPSPVGSFIELRANAATAGPAATLGGADPVNGDTHVVSWGTQRGGLKSDQGASIELGGLNDEPYIDFTRSNDTSTDYDVRIILSNIDEVLEFKSPYGTTVHLTGAPSCVRIAYDRGPKVGAGGCASFSGGMVCCPNDNAASPISGWGYEVHCPSLLDYSGNQVYQLAGLVYPGTAGEPDGGYMLCCEYRILP